MVLVQTLNVIVFLSLVSCAKLMCYFAGLDFRLHQMLKMQTIFTDVCGVCLSVTNALNNPGSASLCWVIGGGGGGACSVHCAVCAGSFGAAFAKCLWSLVWHCKQFL